MRLTRICAVMAVMIAAASGCKQKMSATSRVKGKAESATQGVGNGLNLTGTGFVWERSELPICFAERAGAKFYVWKEQSTFACEKGKKDWQLIATKKG